MHKRKKISILIHTRSDTSKLKSLLDSVASLIFSTSPVALTNLFPIPYTMIIKNGLVIDPASGLSEKMDLLIEDGIIKEMASLITKEGEEVLDAAGLVVAPGLIDTHVHFRDPGFTYKETIHTGALASAKGGFTSVICMANTSPTVDSVPVLKDNLSRASKEKIRIFQAASISCNLKGQEETDMDALKEAGACGFTDDGIPLLNA